MAPSLALCLEAQRVRLLSPVMTPPLHHLLLQAIFIALDALNSALLCAHMLIDAAIRAMHLIH